MTHLTDFADDEGIDDLTLSPLLTLLGAALLAARALFPGRSARQSQVGGRFHYSSAIVSEPHHHA
ncbi:hypothetical protein [Sphingomonas sp.]|uniref:hypothetical protein n=1 Tax=Sphingomonas sp. TaxID=28214 RepID=UPI0035C87802